MSILTDQQKADIRAAVRLVTDQFFVTPVTYKRFVESLDRWNEDRDDSTYMTFMLRAMVDYPKKKNIESLQGLFNNADVVVTCNMEDLMSLDLVNDEKMPIMNPTKDYFIVNGQQYTMTGVTLDGPLDQQNILVIITGDLVTNPS